jgi:predicted glycosyltransferase
VVVPFDRGGESEQMMRAKLLQARSVFELVEEQALAPDTLASAIDAALAAPDRPAPPIDMSGAETSAGLIAGWAKEIAT